MHGNTPARRGADRPIRRASGSSRPSTATGSPLDLTRVGRRPGSRCRSREAVGQDFAPVAPGLAWGAPWGTTWFHVTGRLPDGLAGATAPAVELVVDLGFTADRARASRPRVSSGGRTGRRSRASRRSTRRCRGRAGPDDRRVRRGGRQPGHREQLRVRPDAVRRPGHRRHRPALRAAVRRRRAARRRRLGAAAGPDRAGRADEGAARATRPGGPRSASGSSGCSTLVDPDDVAGTAAAARDGAAAAARAPAVGQRAPRRTPSGTRTSTRPGCGRCARPCASAPAPSRTCSR